MSSSKAIESATITRLIARNTIGKSQLAQSFKLLMDERRQMSWNPNDDEELCKTKASSSLVQNSTLFLKLHRWIGFVA